MNEEQDHFSRCANFLYDMKMQQLQEYRNLSIFQGLSAQQIELIGDALEYRDVSAGETVFVQGADATHLYILLSGRIAVRYKPYDGPVLTIATIIPGWVFGWSALLGRKKYTSGAVALAAGRTVRFSAVDLKEICRISNETGIIFLERISRNITHIVDQTEGQNL